MDQNSVLIHRSERIPKALAPTYRELWEQCTARHQMGAAPVPVRKLMRSLGSGDKLVFESMRVMMDFGTRGRPNWWRAWDVLGEVIARGVELVWLREQLTLSAEGGSKAIDILNAGAAAEADYRAEVAEARRALKNPKGTDDRQRVRGWVKPGKAMLRRVEENARKWGVTKACEEEGISRSTFYEWRDKGLIMQTR
jgi:hypothetical protein|tara:strand:+ start:173 stop:760 length:588 start_codon:yes stop_codon:yes gene_type:complete